jgi:hypothetical protein
MNHDVIGNFSTAHPTFQLPESRRSRAAFAFASCSRNAATLSSTLQRRLT